MSVENEHVRELSAFFPAHNEADNIERTLKSATAALESLALREIELIIVDDGSIGAVISAELLVKLGQSGARLKQVGVPHHPRVAGKPSGGDPRVIARAFRELFRLRRALRAWKPATAPLTTSEDA